MRKSLIATFVCSVMAFNMFQFPVMAETLSDVDLKADKTKVRIDEENKSILFTTSPVDDFEGESVSLVYASTGEKVADLHDDGGFRFEGDGDTYMNDSCYSNYLDFSDKEIGDYTYYVTYTDINGIARKSEDITVHIYRGFTDQELADMEAIQNAIEELLNSEEFKNSTPDKRFELAENLLNDLKEKGLIISYEKSPYGYQIDYVECTGTLGAISESVFIDSDKPVDNVGETTTSSSSTTTTTTTITTTITNETNTEQTTTGTETTLPQTGYSKWYQALIAAAMGMIGVGSTAIVRSGIFRKKESNS